MKTFVLGFLASFTILCSLFGRNSKGDTKFEQRQSINSYCDIACNGTLHTMCVYPVGGGDSCKNELLIFLTLEEKRYILEKLNQFRQLVASGDEVKGIGGGQPPASNMMKLVWDQELSMIAKRWSEQCKEPLHDECRVTLDYMEVGQNVWHGEIDSFAIGSGQQIQSRKMTRLNTIMSDWYDEVKNMDPKWVQHFNASTENTVGNYSQIVWASTTFVGCGYTEIKVSRKIILRFVCNFKPKGNVPESKVYKVGSPCSRCPKRANCSSSFFGLCWNGENSNFGIPSIGNIIHLNQTGLFPLVFIVLSIWYGAIT